MSRVNENPFLMTDVYKVGHEGFYPDKLGFISSYLTTRSDKKYKNVLFFGLQAILLKGFSVKPTKEHVDEFVSVITGITGHVSHRLKSKLDKLVDLGYWPLEIRAIPEGTILPHRQCLTTIENTHEEFAWLVGWFESMLLKVWNTCTVATNSKRYHDLVTSFADITCDDHSHVPFAVHDFGYRGVSSEETAELSGMAHLVSFLGTDTIPAVWAVGEYYDMGNDDPIGLSVPATEHSTMSTNILLVEKMLNEGKSYLGYDLKHIDFQKAFGGDVRLFAEALVIKEIITVKCPSGIVSIVSDTYDYWGVLTKVAPWLKEDILARPEGSKTVFRPDSGSPEEIICGDMEAPLGSPEFEGSLSVLESVFGSTENTKGYTVINPKVGLIYGDGMYYERFKSILEALESLAYATSNLVIGVGGLLLQQHSRDDLGFAVKATFAKVDGESVEVYKDPATDTRKKSHKGIMNLIKVDGEYKTIDQLDESVQHDGLLETVFLNGEFTLQSFDEIRKRVTDS